MGKSKPNEEQERERERREREREPAVVSTNTPPLSFFLSFFSPPASLRLTSSSSEPPRKILKSERVGKTAKEKGKGEFELFPRQAGRQAGRGSQAGWRRDQRPLYSPTFSRRCRSLCVWCVCFEWRRERERKREREREKTQHWCVASRAALHSVERRSSLFFLYSFLSFWPFFPLLHLLLFVLCQ